MGDLQAVPHAPAKRRGQSEKQGSRPLQQNPGEKCGLGSLWRKHLCEYRKDFLLRLLANPAELGDKA